MKTEKNILVAFILNLSFSIIEFIGGLFTNSVAIMSDSVHDMGDAMSIGISYFLEKKSKKKPDANYTFGYLRYSVLGGLITTMILLIGSIFVIYSSISRIITPVDINYNGMIVLAILGVIINFSAAYFTREGDSINQKSVNLHMLEDVFGWVIVLIGAIVMRFTDIRIIDSILSIFVALFIFKSAFTNLKSILDLFLEKTPSGISVEELKHHILEIKGVENVHHVHIWSMDGFNNYATMHVVSNNKDIKALVKEELKEHGISHSTIEVEKDGEECHDKNCKIDATPTSSHAHHHH